MRRKGQTAMEYLMTYGWAILIIIVVVAALYSLGVFSIKPSVACSPCFSYFAFRDYNPNGTLYIVNGPRTIYNMSFNGLSSPSVNPDCTSTGGEVCDPGTLITISDTNLQGRGDVKITIMFTDYNTGVNLKDSATIHKG